VSAVLVREGVVDRVLASILSQLLHQAATTGRIRIFDDSLTAARDYIPVENVTTTILQLATASTPVPAAVYNLGSSFATTFADVAQWCARLHRQATGRPLLAELVPNPLPAAYQYFTCADTTALDNALPEPQTITPASLEARATALFEGFRDHATG